MKTKGKKIYYLGFWANKKIKKPTIIKFGKTIKECKHRWRIGSWNGNIRKCKNGNMKIIKESLNIWCEKCNKRIKAWKK